MAFKQPKGTTDRPTLSTRLLRQSAQVMQRSLVPVASAALESARQGLFQRAEQSTVAQVQEDWLRARRELEIREDAFCDDFGRALALHFADPKRWHVRRDYDPTRDDFQIVPEAELDESLAIDNFVSRAEIRFTPELYALNQRLSAVVGGASFDNETNPAAPFAIGEAVRRATQVFDLALEPKLILLKELDRALIDGLRDCYEELNDILEQAGVLPNLRYKKKRSDRKDKPPAPEQSQTESPMPSASGLPTAAATPLLDIPGLSDSPTASEVGQHFLRQLEQSQGGVGNTERETINVMTMLFQLVERQQQMFHETVVQLLGKLQTPLMQVAMKDENFLEKPTHPARQLFQKLAEAGSEWVDEEDRGRRSTLSKMEAIVHQITEEQETDTEVYEQLLDDLTDHIEFLKKKAQNAEQRHIQAMQGREKLVMARDRAEDEVRKALKVGNPPKFIREFLEQSWADYISLICLRYGAEGEDWESAKLVTESLASLDNDSRRAESTELVRTKYDELVAIIDDGLRQIGYAKNDVDSIASNLDRWLAWDADRKGPEPDVEALASTGGERSHTPAMPPKPARELNEDEKRALARLRLMQFGTWFEFDDREARGGKKLKKLAWFSPMSSHCLFVDRRGQHPEELAMERVAIDMVAGSVRVKKQDERPYFERAMNALFARGAQPGAAY